MEKIIYEQSNLPFKENQIVCLEHQNSCLYGEAIELILSRQMCWFRPICLNRVGENADSTSDKSQWIRLSSASDLLWPIWLFRPALDIEVISWLGHLDPVDKSPEAIASSRQYLNQFVREIWTAHQDKF